MDYYIIYEIGDASKNGYRYIWPTIYSSYEDAVAEIQAKIDKAGQDEYGEPVGFMENDSSRAKADSEDDGTMVGNLHDYDCQYFVKKLSMHTKN
jgi:hypothetical protein